MCPVLSALSMLIVNLSQLCHSSFSVCFFFNDAATTEIYTLSLHDALPICGAEKYSVQGQRARPDHLFCGRRSEEHTSELQSPYDLVCRLLLDKKKTKRRMTNSKKKKYKMKSIYIKR